MQSPCAVYHFKLQPSRTANQHLSMVSNTQREIFRTLSISPVPILILPIGLFIIFYLTLNLLFRVMYYFVYAATAFFLLLSHQQLILACYHPDGSDSHDRPCNTTVEGAHSACCSQGDFCTSRGWCVGNAGFLYRGGCTDSTWASEQCNPWCRDGNTVLSVLSNCELTSFCKSGCQQF